MEKINLEIIRNGEVVNTFENEKTNLIKLLSYMSGRALKGSRCYYKIKVVHSYNRNGIDLADIEIIFKDEPTLKYLWHNVPLDSYGVISEQAILKVVK